MTLTFDKTVWTNREVLKLATLARESADNAARQAQNCAKNGDSEGHHFHTGRQAAFLTMYHAVTKGVNEKNQDENAV